MLDMIKDVNPRSDGRPNTYARRVYDLKDDETGHRIRLDFANADAEAQFQAEQLVTGQRLKVVLTNDSPPPPSLPSSTPEAVDARLADSPPSSSKPSTVASLGTQEHSTFSTISVSSLELLVDESDEAQGGSRRRNLQSILSIPTFPYSPKIVFAIISNCGAKPAMSTFDVFNAMFVKTDVLFPGQSFMGWHQACSYGQVNMIPSNVKILTVPICAPLSSPSEDGRPSLCTDYAAVSGLAHDVVVNQLGVNLSEYRHIVYMMPAYPSCSWPITNSPPPIGEY